ncbi:MAG: hypothetical protein WCJ61_01255 [Paludibacter sp.]
MKIQFTLLIIFAFSTGISSQISNSKWQAQPIVIDGDAADWVSIPRFFNAESNVQYEFRNDANNLFIIIKATERATQMQLLRAGFSVRLKVKTSPPSKFGITFHGIRNAMPPNRNNQVENSGVLVEKTSMKPQIMTKDSAFLDGFQFSNGVITSENNDPNGIYFARNKANREQVLYEFLIPLSELYGNNFVLEKIAVVPIQLQVVINELSHGEISKMRGKSGRRMSGGMQGSRGGSGEMSGRGSGVMGRGMGGENEMGGEMGENISGGEMKEPSSNQDYERPNGFSMSKKSFDINFYLSVGK